MCHRYTSWIYTYKYFSPGMYPTHWYVMICERCFTSLRNNSKICFRKNFNFILNYLAVSPNKRKHLSSDWLAGTSPSRLFIPHKLGDKMSSIVECGCSEAAQEVFGVTRIIKAIAYAKCPITLSGTCEYPESCLGCYEVITQELEQ